MAEQKIVAPLVKRDPARFRGPLNSEQHNTFQDDVVHDIHALGSAVNAQAASLRGLSENLGSETLFLKRRLQSLEEARDYREHTFGKAGIKIDRYIDFHDTSNFLFPATLDAAQAAPFKGQFGEVFLPAVSIENKFYNFSLRTTEVVVPDDLVIDVAGTFDKTNGLGLQDYENGGKVSAGDPVKAFNGINESSWIRKVTFPLESNVDQVEVQLTAIVPAGVSSKANLIEIVPHPEGSVDITDISTSPDLTASFTSIEGFTSTNNVTAKRYHFPPRNVDQVRIRLRSRNWREINGKKVFIYGLQELGLKLVDYEKGTNATDNFGDKPTAVVQLDAPTNHTFLSLYRIDPTPNFLLEDNSVRHVRLRISTGPDFSNVIWDSDIHAPPQLGVSTGVALGSVSTLYAIFTFKFVNESGGLSSPYFVGTTSYMRGLGLVFTATPTNANN